MPLILRSLPGKVAVIIEPNAIPALVHVRGFLPIRAIITRLEHGQAANVHLMTTLQNVIYAYTTGDKIGTLTVSGLAFASMCNDNSSRHGIMEAYGFFDDNKISDRNPPVIVTVGSKSIAGLLTSCSIGIENAEYQFAQFSFRFDTLPKASNLRASSRQLPDVGGAAEVPEKETPAAAGEIPKPTNYDMNKPLGEKADDVESNGAVSASPSETATEAAGANQTITGSAPHEGGVVPTDPTSDYSMSAEDWWEDVGLEGPSYMTNEVLEHSDYSYPTTPFGKYTPSKAVLGVYSNSGVGCDELSNDRYGYLLQPGVELGKDDVIRVNRPSGVSRNAMVWVEWDEGIPYRVEVASEHVWHDVYFHEDASFGAPHPFEQLIYTEIPTGQQYFPLGHRTK